MAGIVSPSMPVWIIENREHGNRAFATLNEGLGKVLRFGAFAPEVIERLKWMESTLAPVLADAIERHGEVDLRALIAQALQMGDEGHNRNKAGTSLLIRELAPSIALAGAPDKDQERRPQVHAFQRPLLPQPHDGRRPRARSTRSRVSPARAC